MIIRPTEQRGLSASNAPSDYDDGRLIIRPTHYLAFADGKALSLTMRELGLLVELSRHVGSIRSRKQLVKAVWGPSADISPRAVDVIVARLRAKLDDALPDLSYIHSYHERGYGFDQQPYTD